MMHALHKILADKARPERAAVTPGEVVEIEPDVYSAIVGVNAGEAKRLAADLAELGVKELPLRDRIYASSDHASPAPTVALAASQNAWRDFYRSYGIKIFDGGMGVSHLVMVEQGIVVPGSMAIAVDSHGATMGAVGAYATSLGGGRLTLYALGRHWIEVPKVTLVRISGKIKKGVLGRDVALYVNGRLGQRGAYGNAVEFAGSFVEQTSGRRSPCRMPRTTSGRSRRSRGAGSTRRTSAPARAAGWRISRRRRPCSREGKRTPMCVSS